MSKVNEDLIIQYLESFPKKHLLHLSIPIDSNGYGKTTFEASNYLESVILPKMISFPTVRIYSQNSEDYVVFDLKEQTETRIFFPRIQLCDITGKTIDYFDKIYLSGVFVVEISKSIPDSDFEMFLVV